MCRGQTDFLGLRPIVKNVILGDARWIGEGDRISEFPVGDDTLADLVNPDDDCDCIASLMVVVHGNTSNGSVLIQESSGDGGALLWEDNVNTGISDLFSGIRFCKTCFLEIRGCFLGSSDILRHRLEEGSGCHVTLYPYPVDMDGVMRDAEDMGDEFHFPGIEWIIGLFF